MAIKTGRANPNPNPEPSENSTEFTIIKPDYPLIHQTKIDNKPIEILDGSIETKGMKYKKYLLFG